jgi:hypothetical protein
MESMKHITLVTALVITFACSAMSDSNDTTIYNSFARLCYSHRLYLNSRQIKILQDKFDASFFKEPHNYYLKATEELLVAKEKENIYMRRLSLEKRNNDSHEVCFIKHIDKRIDRQEVIDTLNDIDMFLPEGKLFTSTHLVKIYPKGKELLNMHKKELKN